MLVNNPIWPDGHK